jgi:hypothetical protein
MDYEAKIEAIRSAMFLGYGSSGCSCDVCKAKNQALAILDSFPAPAPPPSARALAQVLFDGLSCGIRDGKYHFPRPPQEDKEWASSLIVAALQREREEADRDLLDAAEAYQNLAMCYLLGKTPSDKVFEQLEKARETIAKARAAILADQPKGKVT